MQELLKKRLEKELWKREESGNLRSLKAETDLIDFYSNDYLGFARSPLLKTLLDKELARYPSATIGSTGSRLLSGNSDYAMRLEEETALFFKTESCLLFNSGFDANLALLSTLPTKTDTIICDERVHSSMLEGARLSLAQKINFRHNDADSLRKKIMGAKGTVFVAVESLYSMDGDFAPLSDLASVCREEGANLIVDEAHTTGIAGLYGEGLVNQMGLGDQVFACVFTFGKALGTHGACIAGSSLLTNYLINFARPFIFSTALPFHTLASIRVALAFLREDQHARKCLHLNIAAFRTGIASSLDTFERKKDFGSGKLYTPQYTPHYTPIYTLFVPGNQPCRDASNQLAEKGLHIRPILHPTVAAGFERLRICLHSYNTSAELNLLIAGLKELGLPV